MDRLRCTIPMPPSRASAIARRASVTVSIAAETTGIASSIPGDRRAHARGARLRRVGCLRFDIDPLDDPAARALAEQAIRPHLSSDRTRARNVEEEPAGIDRNGSSRAVGRDELELLDTAEID